MRFKHYCCAHPFCPSAPKILEYIFLIAPPSLTNPSFTPVATCPTIGFSYIYRDDIARCITATTAFPPSIVFSTAAFPLTYT